MIWREIRGFKDFVIIGSESDTHGIQIFDMRKVFFFSFLVWFGLGEGEKEGRGEARRVVLILGRLFWLSLIGEKMMIWILTRRF